MAWVIVLQVFVALCYAFFGGVVGNALVHQLDGEDDGPLMKVGVFLVGLVFWPIVVVVTLVMLVHALTHDGAP